uniref:Death-associated protein kinase 2 n=1 Tax=Callorhinchus milii TaxID=7868 RepID=V9KRC3_CALMI
MSLYCNQNMEDIYEFQDTLGNGHFGVVRRCRDRVTGEGFAAKFVKLRHSRSSRRGVDPEQMEKEIRLLHEAQHIHVITLRHVFHSHTHTVLILELVLGGELFDYVAEKESLSEEQAIEFLQQILDAVAYLHSKLIVHFDLKPENIMLLEKAAVKPHIKLIDFGLAHQLREGHPYRCMSGTPQYIAPEVINYEVLGTAADMWSLGVITYILLSGLSPFQGDTDGETLGNVVTGGYDFDEQYFRETSGLAKDFIQRLLVREPGLRMSAAESLKHPWIKPQTAGQAVVRRLSAINMEKFKLYARRRWKISFCMVSACNRLHRLRLGYMELGEGGEEEGEDDVFRRCESDQEDEERPPEKLFMRPRSSSS